MLSGRVETQHLPNDLKNKELAYSLSFCLPLIQVM